MDKVFIPDEILLQVDKPARYTGNELNMVKKNPEDMDIRFAFCFPDVYEVGHVLSWASDIIFLFEQTRGYLLRESICSMDGHGGGNA